MITLEYLSKASSKLSEKFGFWGFLLKTNISKFQFDLDCCQALSHEPLAWVIAQAFPVFDVKFTFTSYKKTCEGFLLICIKNNIMVLFKDVRAQNFPRTDFFKL